MLVVIVRPFNHVHAYDAARQSAFTGIDHGVAVFAQHHVLLLGTCGSVGIVVDHRRTREDQLRVRVGHVDRAADTVFRGVAGYLTAGDFQRLASRHVSRGALIAAVSGNFTTGDFDLTAAVLVNRAAAAGGFASLDLSAIGQGERAVALQVYRAAAATVADGLASLYRTARNVDASTARSGNRAAILLGCTSLNRTVGDGGSAASCHGNRAAAVGGSTILYRSAGKRQSAVALHVYRATLIGLHRAGCIRAADRAAGHGYIAMIRCVNRAAYALLPGCTVVRQGGAVFNFKGRVGFHIRAAAGYCRIAGDRTAGDRHLRTGRLITAAGSNRTALAAGTRRPAIGNPTARNRHTATVLRVHGAAAVHSRIVGKRTAGNLRLGGTGQEDRAAATVVVRGLVVGDGRSAAAHFQRTGGHIHRAAAIDSLVSCNAARSDVYFGRAAGSIDRAAGPRLAVGQQGLGRNGQLSGLNIQYAAILMKLVLAFRCIPLLPGVVRIPAVQLQVFYCQITVGLDHAAHFVKIAGYRRLGSNHAGIDVYIARLPIQRGFR